MVNYQLSPKVVREKNNMHRRSLMVKYQRSLKVAKRYQSPMFIDGKLPTFTEGREKTNIIALTFTDGELPMFTEGSKKIIMTNVH